MTTKRYLESPIVDDLSEKMVFVAGPRQVGKTTMARRLLDNEARGLYLSWDNRDHRRTIRRSEWPADESLIVLDELHKWRNWKSWIKGEFDTHRDRLRFLVTGSARLDVYRRGGDSLQGRYHHYRLHPFSLAELDFPVRSGTADVTQRLSFRSTTQRTTIETLMRFGGFPEPFLAQSDRTHRRWQKDRIDRVLLEDVRDLEEVRTVSQVQLLADLLPERVASLFSLNSLREDLEASHRAVGHWMDILDRLYYCFRITPWDSRQARTLKRIPKLYMWDWSEVRSKGARFENLIATHLLKFCHFIEDSEGYRANLHFLRDRAGHEVDFLVTIDGNPWFSVEVKVSDGRVEPSITYFKDRLRIPFCYQVTLDGNRNALIDGVHVLPAHVFLSALV